jgi:hypothetical protein
MHERSFDAVHRPTRERQSAHEQFVMRANPLETNPEREAHIREVAYRMWEENGRPHGRDVEFWERARELVGMKENRGAGQLPRSAESSPKVEEAERKDNLGEFPGVADQGEKAETPRPRRRRRQAADLPKAR